MHPEEPGGKSFPTRSDNGQFDGGGQADGFAKSVEAAIGQSKRMTNIDVARATELCDAALDLIHGTKFDTGAYMDRLRKRHLSPHEQCDVVKEGLIETFASRRK